MKENSFQLNERIAQFIREKDVKGASFSKEDIAFINQYEGSGGLGKKGASGEGVLYEFYTPDDIIEQMWKLANYHGYDGGAVLESSIGTGKMIAGAPNKSNCVGFEINPIAARIAQLTYPAATIYEGYFESAFLQAPRFTSRIKEKLTWLDAYLFSLVIGNPPYGLYKNKYSSYFPTPKIRQMEIFFMLYGLKLLKKDGLLVYLTSSNFLRNGDAYNDSKKELEKIATLVDAYRLPPIFKTSEVPVDIIVMRKK